METSGGSGGERDIVAFPKTKLEVLSRGLLERAHGLTGPRMLTRASERFSQGKEPLPTTHCPVPRAAETSSSPPLLGPLHSAALRGLVGGEDRKEVFSPMG